MISSVSGPKQAPNSSNSLISNVASFQYEEFTSKYSLGIAFSLPTNGIPKATTSLRTIGHPSKKLGRKKSLT